MYSRKKEQNVKIWGGKKKYGKLEELRVVQTERSTVSCW